MLKSTVHIDFDLINVYLYIHPDADLQNYIDTNIVTNEKKVDYYYIR